MSRTKHPRQVRSTHLHLTAVTLVLGLAGLLASCSFKSFDYLQQGGEAGNAGSNDRGGSGGKSSSGGNSQGGNSAGGSSQGGNSAGGSSQGGSNPGGSNQGGNSAGGAGGSSEEQFGGSSAAGGSVASTTAIPACPYAGPGNFQFIKPPSNDFETGATDWTTIGYRPGEISTLSDSNNPACQGTQFLRCQGTGRQDAWDGPAVDVFPMLVPGHNYSVSVAMRFGALTFPADAPPATMKLSIVMRCEADSSNDDYRPVTTKSVATHWVRATGTFQATKPAKCATNWIGAWVYIETGSKDFRDIEIDDFQLYDLSTPATTGTGGATGAGGTTSGT